MSRVVHFEIHASEPEQAITFYSSVFGWEFTSFGGGNMEYWLIKTGPSTESGIDGGLVRRRGGIDGTAVIAYVCTIQVTDLDATLAKAEKAGGTMALAKMPIPGVGWLAYMKDPQGNIFGMMQPDPKAGIG